MATSRGTQVFSGRATGGRNVVGASMPGRDPGQSGTAVRPSDMVGGSGEKQGEFFVSSYTLNVADNKPFPGNIQPEGYFYSPFHEVAIKELDDELQASPVARINFIPSESSVNHLTDIEFYNPEVGCNTTGNLYDVRIMAPVSYGNLLIGQPFCIYDVLNEETYRGYLNAQDGRELSIYTSNEIDEDGLDGNAGNGKSRYIISYLTENAPSYAEYIPAEERLVWRGVKKMSDLRSDSPLYNAPFTNGRIYIQRNVNVFVRRQDPHNDYYLRTPSTANPLRRFQIEGDAKLDFDYIRFITDSMIDAC